MKNYYQTSALVAAFLTALIIKFLFRNRDKGKDENIPLVFRVNNTKQEILNSFFEVAENERYYLQTTFYKLGGDVLFASQIEIYFNKTTLDLYSLKVGDTLQIPQKIVYWKIFSTGTGDAGDSEYESGSIFVKRIDVANRVMILQFKNFKINHNYENTSFMINGELNIDFIKY